MSSRQPSVDEIGCQLNLITGEHYGPCKGSCKGETQMGRMTRDTMLMKIASIAAERGTCTRLSVGAVVAREGRVISQGYVGSPPGIRHCNVFGCLIVDGHCIRTTHAEMNALLFAARYGIGTYGAELYVTHSPCYTCAKAAITAGISRIVYGALYGDESSQERVLKLLTAASIRYDAYYVGEETQKAN